MFKRCYNKKKEKRKLKSKTIVRSRGDVICVLESRIFYLKMVSERKNKFFDRFIQKVFLLKKICFPSNFFHYREKETKLLCNIFFSACIIKTKEMIIFTKFLFTRLQIGKFSPISILQVLKNNFFHL